MDEREFVAAGFIQDLLLRQTPRTAQYDAEVAEGVAAVDAELRGLETQLAELTEREGRILQEQQIYLEKIAALEQQ
ncbi:hypothetical protein SS50377_28209 [Spironucleus salmonicida]|uniref:Uncharacterized protein n=1 Tax=Spironucleus salmonicida TaxID=348837 RepID=V6LP30_9EUKA|nr:hypothetical protein SS50377_28198 [Spironucleus salmonicida]KAH0570234.1 hypothetical protein SS50377_28209 [Spironucleus salmonicida]|eukprot:EST46360.1 Hypothetical protein SS50377_13603 [Spironucleus salmonicida]